MKLRADCVVQNTQSDARLIKFKEFAKHVNEGRDIVAKLKEGQVAEQFEKRLLRLL